MYDWANSAYVLTVMSALLPVYFSDTIVGSSGFRIGDTVYNETTLWAYTISAAGFLIFLLSPVMGAIADLSAAKKKFLMTFCYLGSLSTILLYFCTTGDVWMTMALTLLAQIGLVGGNVFYDSFLPHLGDRLDRISARGFAYGYLGGDLQFLISLGLVMLHDSLGLSMQEAVRIALSLAGVWWAGFSIFTWVGLKEPPSVHVRSRGSILIAGLRQTWKTTREVGRYRHLVIFLCGFMMYNEGIQTVIAMSTIFGKQELKLSTPVLMVTLFFIQILAMAGSILGGRLAERWTVRKTLIVVIFIWLGVVVYAYNMTTATEYMVLGGIVGVVLGSSQALSRSYYGAMIPKEFSAEFFGFYSTFTKFSAIWGPLVFGWIRQATGSARLSILSVAAFFLVGVVFLLFTREPRSS